MLADFDSLGFIDFAIASRKLIDADSDNEFAIDSEAERDSDLDVLTDADTLSAFDVLADCEVLLEVDASVDLAVDAA